MHKGADPLLPAADAAALAYGCAASYRYTDNQGGCDGARIRFSPEVNFPANAGALEAIGKLRGVKKVFGARLSWADLITLAGHAAVAPHSGPMPFCGGRTDATDGAGSRWLQPLSAPSSAAYFKEHPTGLTAREVLAVWAAASRAVAATRRPPADFFRWVALATPTEVRAAWWPPSRTPRHRPFFPRPPPPPSPPTPPSPGGRDARRSARGPRRRGAARGGPRLRLRPGRAQGSAREGVAATDVSWPIRRPRLQPVRRPCGDSDASADRRARAARLIPLTPTGRNFCVY